MKSRTLRLLVAATLAAVPVAYIAAQTSQPPQATNRGTAFAPWDPAKMDERRKQYGFVGPGPKAKPPEARFPTYLKKPQTVE
jgi:hypothetical protein